MQPAPEGGVGGERGPAGPPAEPGCTRRAGTPVEELQSGLRPGAAGLEGNDAYPAVRRLLPTPARALPALSAGPATGRAIASMIVTRTGLDPAGGSVASP